MEQNKKIGFMWWFLIAGVLVYFPLMSAGVMHNDELLARYWSMRGVKDFFEHSFNELLVGKGRAMSCLVIPVTEFLGYIGRSSFCFKILQIVTIMSNVVFFCKLVKEIFGDKVLAGIVGTFLLLFMPFSFEPTLPNAYVTLYGIPLTLLYISLLFYLFYIKKGKRKYIIISMSLFFISCCCYEAFVTYTPVFLILFLWKKRIHGISDLKTNMKQGLIPIALGCLFLICYVIAGILFPSQYEGNQISFTVLNALEIIAELFKISLPGGLLLSHKYNFLFNNYKDLLTLDGILRIGCVVLILVICFGKIINIEKKEGGVKYRFSPILLILLIGFTILPFLPIAISKMYQNNVGENGFVALPVTYFSFYVTTLGMGYIVRAILRCLKNNKIIQILIVFLILFLGIKIQLRNEVFTKEMKNNFERLENIEDIFRTDTMVAFDGSSICAKDIFQTKNTLAIHDSYWNHFSRLVGRKIKISKEADSVNYYLFETNDRLYSLVNSEYTKVAIFSKEEIRNPIAVKVGEEKYILYEEITAPLQDKAYYVYYSDLNIRDE